MENLKNKAISAVIWDLIGKLSDQGVGFVISIFLARLLTPSEFGLVAMVTVVIAIAKSLMDMGLGVSLIQKKDVTDEHYGSVFFFNVFSGLILTIVFYLCAGLIADFYNNQEIKPLFQVLSSLFLISSFSNVQRIWLTKKIKYKLITFSSVTGVLFGGSVGVWMAFHGYGVWSLVGQALVSGLSSNIFIYLFAGWKPRLVFSLNALKELWDFGFKMFVSGLIGTITSQLDSLIIGKNFTPASLGLYNRAKTFNGFIIKYTSGSLMSIMFPVLSSIKDDEVRYQEIVRKTFHLLNFVTFLMLGVLFFIVEDLVVLLFTEKWLPSVIYFKILLLAGYGYPLSSLLVNIISSRGNSKSFLQLEVIKQVLFLLILIFGFIYGIKGYLYLSALVTLISVALNIKFAAKEMKVKMLWFYKIIFPYLALNLVTFIIVFFINNYLIINNSILSIVAFGSIYLFINVFLMYLFKMEAIKIIHQELTLLIRKFIFKNV